MPEDSFPTPTFLCDCFLKIPRSSVLSAIFLLSILSISYFLVNVGDEQTLKNIMNPLISGLITAFTFCFSLSFIIFNTAVQRFGRESYDLLDKKPLLLLVITFFACLLLSVFVNAIPILRNTTIVIAIGKIAVMANVLFFASIVPYFFWLIDHVSSKSMLRNILENLAWAIVENNKDMGEQLLKGLLETTFRVIDEHDHSSFSFLITNICKIQSRLLNLFCRTPLNSQRREILESLWFSLNMSMGMIAEKACENDSSYLNEIAYFHKEKLKAIFSSEASYGGLSPTYSDVIVEFELNIVYSFLCYLVERLQESKRHIGQKHMEAFFEQSFMSVDVITDATSTPTNLLDFFYDVFLFIYAYEQFFELIKCFDGVLNIGVNWCIPIR